MTANKGRFHKDNLYQSELDDVVDFAFDEKVVAVFPDMIHRSIPGYASLLTVLQAVFRQHFANQNQLHVYDLGCSLGAVTLALSSIMPIDTRYTGIDLSAEMIKKYNEAMRIASLEQNAVGIEGDINEVKLADCDAICLNFVLQFINPEQRLALLTKCFKQLANNGLLFIAEKVKADDSTIAWHEQFKRNNGYSDLEIAQKRSAIENIMRIDSASTIVNRLHDVGFKQVIPVFQCLSFHAWVAVK